MDPIEEAVAAVYREIQPRLDAAEEESEKLAAQAAG
jgi:hypothetical protein